MFFDSSAHAAYGRPSMIFSFSKNCVHVLTSISGTSRHACLWRLNLCSPLALLFAYIGIILHKMTNRFFIVTTCWGLSVLPKVRIGGRFDNDPSLYVLVRLHESLGLRALFYSFHAGLCLQQLCTAVCHRSLTHSRSHTLEAPPLFIDADNNVRIPLKLFLGFVHIRGVRIHIFVAL